MSVASHRVASRRAANQLAQLMFASLQGKVEMVRALLELGADPWLAENMGYTPIHGCAFQGRPAVCKLLIERGLAGIDAATGDQRRHRDGYAPVHRTVWGTDARHVETLQVFLVSCARSCSFLPTNIGSR